MTSRFGFVYALMMATLLVSCGESANSIQVSLLDPCRLSSPTSCDELSPTPSEQSLCGDAFCAQKAVWAQLAVFPEGCPTDELLREGVLTGAMHVVSTEAGRALPELGKLEEARFGFAGLLRASDCAIVGAGCTEADLSTIRRVRVEMRPVSGSAGCHANDACQEGACVSAAEADGESCLPRLIASGELPERAIAEAIASGPGIVATNLGYLIGYREDIPSQAGTTARVRLVPIADNGSVGKTIEQPIESCETAITKGGIGMAMALDQGLLVTEYPACGNQGAGATFISFTPGGAILDVTTFAGALPHVSLANVHSLSLGQSRNSFELAYLASGAAFRLNLVGARAQDGYAPIFPDRRFGFIQIASSKDAIAYLAGGEDAPDALLGMSNWDEPPVLTSLPKGWVGAVAVDENRAVAVTLLDDGGISWTGQSTTGAALGTGSLHAGGPFTAVEVGIADKQVVLAAGRPGAIHLAPIGSVATKLADRATVLSQYEPTLGNVSLSAYDGERLALATKDDGFALAFIESRKGAGKVGGFAIFECAK